MTISRYSFVRTRTSLTGKLIKTNSESSYRIYRAVESGKIQCSVKVLEEGERLDTLSGLYYEDSSLWWVIAAASGIGWGLQVPPGTVIRIPNNISEVLGVI